MTLQETTRQPRGGLSRGLGCPHFSGTSLCEGRGRSQGTGRDTAPGTQDHGKQGRPRQTRARELGWRRARLPGKSGREKVGPCTPVSYSASSGQDPPGRTLAPSRGSCSRRPDRPLTRPCCHSGRHRYISSGQRQGPDNEMPTTAWLCHRLQTESEIRGVLGQWKPEARLTADNREASRKQGLPSGSITKSLAPF